MEQPVARLVIEETDASGEAGEVLLIHRPGGLIGAGDRNTAFLQQLAQRGAVGGLARHQPQQDDRVFGLFDKLRHVVNGGFRCRAHQRRAAGRQNCSRGGLVDNILRQADKSAPRPAVLGGAKRVGNHLSDRVRRTHFDGVFRDRDEHGDGVHALVHQFGFICPLHRPAQRHDRVAFAVGGGNAGDQVRTAGPGGHQRHPGLAGQTPYRRRHERRVRFVTHRNNLDGGVQQGVKDLVDFRPRDPEHLLHALRFQLADNQIGAVRPLT